MRKLIYVMHISLDGYYADNKGNMRWVQMTEEIGTWVHQFIQACDASAYGRVTYDMMAAFWPGATENPQVNTSRHVLNHASWVNPAQKYVFSRTLEKTGWQPTEIIKDNIVDAMKNIKQRSGGNIALLGSGSIAQLFMSHGLIDDYYLTISPVTLGAGAALFHQPLSLKLMSSTAFPNGSVGLHYQPI
jgi:dihydrofolate reductase